MTKYKSYVFVRTKPDVGKHPTPKEGVNVLMFIKNFDPKEHTEVDDSIQEATTACTDELGIATLEHEEPGWAWVTVGNAQVAFQVPGAIAVFI